MEKRKRERGVHTAVVLPPDVLEKLRGSHYGVSEEIRRRINRTLYQDSFGEITRGLSEDVMGIADEISRQIGFPWNSSRRGHLALATALQTFLELVTPPSGDTEDLFGPDDPATLGRSVARYYPFLKSKREDQEQELRVRHPLKNKGFVQPEMSLAGGGPRKSSATRKKTRDSHD